MEMKITSTLLIILIGSGTLLQANATRESLQQELEAKIMACDANAFKKQFIDTAAVTTPDEQEAFKQALISCVHAVKAYKALELNQTQNKTYIQNRPHAWKALWWGIPTIIFGITWCKSGYDLVAHKESIGREATFLLCTLVTPLCVYKTIHNGRKALYYADVLKQEIAALDEIIKLINQDK